MSLEFGKLADFVNCAVDEAVFVAQKMGYPIVNGKRTGVFPLELLQIVEDAKTQGTAFITPILEDIAGEPWIRPFSVEKVPV